MPYIPKRGHALLIPSGTASSPDQKHLFVVITERCSANRHLLVNVTTIKDGVHFDPACIIEIGEHDFIMARSYVVYRLARTDHTDHLSRMVDGWTFHRKNDVSETLLTRICDGVLNSEFIRRSDRDYFRQATGR